MSEASAEYAHRHIPKKLAGIPVHYLSWKQINHLTGIKKGTNSEKRLLHELRSYLGGIVKMQNQESNLVYVVALATGTPEWSKISWKDIVNKKNRYFHPFGVKGWPKEPPNYLGFRHDGKLQSIRHVEAWRVVDDR